MKKGRRHSAFSLSGALLFFALTACIIQIAVLSFDAITQKTDSRAVIAASMLGVIVVLAAVCTTIDFLRRKYTVEQPVGKILDATRRMTAGDFSVRLEIAHPYGKYNEFDRIAENVNVLAAELKKNEILHTDFIANVSHELKTPLAVIGNYAALLEVESDAAARKKYAQTVQAAAKRLSALVSDILKLNKLENQLPLEAEPLDLTAHLAESAAQFEEACEQKGLTLKCDLDDVRIVSVPSYLEIVWSNLLGNAVKFTPPGGTVGVTLRERGGDAVVRVRDTGCGISPETGARIFEKFYQGDTSRAQAGNGLGLALVKKVIDLMGGEITVESTVGEGSVFTVVLRGQDAS